MQVGIYTYLYRSLSVPIELTGYATPPTEWVKYTDDKPQFFAHGPRETSRSRLHHSRIHSFRHAVERKDMWTSGKT